MIDEELKAILACPACKGDLLFEETRIICPAHSGRNPRDADQRGRALVAPSMMADTG